MVSVLGWPARSPERTDHRARCRCRCDHQPPRGRRRTGHPVGAGRRHPLCRRDGLRRTQSGAGNGCSPTGVTENALAALHAPIGLDIGADQPAEIAVSILAEVVAVRSGRLADIGAVSSIGDRDGAIHPELHPVRRTCPGG